MLTLLCVRLSVWSKCKLLCLALITFVNNVQFNLVVMFAFFVNNSLVINLIEMKQGILLYNYIYKKTRLNWRSLKHYRWQNHRDRTRASTLYCFCLFFSSFEHAKNLLIMGPNNIKNSSKSVIFLIFNYE